VGVGQNQKNPKLEMGGIDYRREGKAIFLWEKRRGSGHSVGLGGLPTNNSEEPGYGFGYSNGPLTNNIAK
jgi:hypothetical protein